MYVYTRLHDRRRKFRCQFTVGHGCGRSNVRGRMEIGSEMGREQSEFLHVRDG